MISIENKKKQSIVVPTIKKSTVEFLCSQFHSETLVSFEYRFDDRKDHLVFFALWPDDKSTSKNINNNKRKSYIYVLRLQNEKYYVGKSYNPANRYISHTDAESITGSAWTRQHPPIEMFDQSESVDPYQEDNVTKEMMRIFGIANVRGGTFSRPLLADYHQKSLELEVEKCSSLSLIDQEKCDRQTAEDQRNHAKGGCFRCGETGHFIQDCIVNLNNWTGLVSIDPDRMLLYNPTNNETYLNFGIYSGMSLQRLTKSKLEYIRYLMDVHHDNKILIHIYQHALKGWFPLPC